jgi:signal peptidase I
MNIDLKYIKEQPPYNPDFPELQADSTGNTQDNAEDAYTGQSHGNKKKIKEKDSGMRFMMILLLILIPIRLFVAEPFLVYGSSMDPTFHSGDYLIVDEISYKISPPKRGDIVVFKPPYDDTRHFIKRIVGLPGETVQVDGENIIIFNTEYPYGLTLNEPYIRFQSDKKVKIDLKNDEYFVAGDNRSVSFDSRSWGALPSSNITGKALMRLYPFDSMGILPGKIQEGTY